MSFVSTTRRGFHMPSRDHYYLVIYTFFLNLFQHNFSNMHIFVFSKYGAKKLKSCIHNHQNSPSLVRPGCVVDRFSTGFVCVDIVMGHPINEKYIYQNNI